MGKRNQLQSFPDDPGKDLFKRITYLKSPVPYPGSSFRWNLILFFVTCILVTEIVKGESHSSPSLLFPSLEIERSGMLSSHSGPDSGEEGSIYMNNSDSSSRIYEIRMAQVEVKGFQAYRKIGPTNTIDLLERRRKRAGYFSKDEEKQQQQEEFDRSFRLFWFLGGVAIVFFICVFILTLLCLCCPAMKNKRRKDIPVPTIIPRISTSAEPDLDGVLYQPSDIQIDIEGRVRSRSPSVYSVNAVYMSHHRLSQEQVNAIQIQSQSRRSSNINMPTALPIPSTSQGLSPASALIDVSVVQEHRPETILSA